MKWDYLLASVAMIKSGKEKKKKNRKLFGKGDLDLMLVLSTVGSCLVSPK